jgi:hypothetical protein
MESQTIFFARLALSLFLFLIFLYQAEIQVIKFLRGDITQSFRPVKVPELKYPVMTICPEKGFNYTFLEENNLSGIPSFHGDCIAYI